MRVRVDGHRCRRRPRRRQSQREAIDANLDHGLSQGLIESTNTKIRVLTRIAFGFQGLYPYPPSPVHYSLSAAAYPDSQAEPDPHIQQESDICATRSGEAGSAYCRLCASQSSRFGVE